MNEILYTVILNLFQDLLFINELDAEINSAWQPFIVLFKTIFLKFAKVL